MGAFTVVRRARIAADPARVHALIDDFHAWRQWSPWEDVDPAMQREYSGPDAGEGAGYAWQGNRKAGSGSMEITSSRADRITIDLRFTRPFRADNDLVFELVPAGEGTDVTWRMSGEQTGVWALLGKLMPMDRLVGKDFEKGLSRLASAAES
ncbi:MAG: SRPBCC family protein [Nocardioides sp.]